MQTEPNPDTDLFQDQPVLVVEVLSDSARRIDEHEKSDAYLTINSLHVYLLVEQDLPEAVKYRRGENGFQREEHTGIEAVIPLEEIGCHLNLSGAYENLTFPAPDATSD